MSSTGRKDFSSKVSETVTPDNSKSGITKVKEAATDAADRVAREFEPDHNKSGTQGAYDKAERTKDHTKHGSTENTIADKVKNVFGMNKNN